MLCLAANMSRFCKNKACQDIELSWLDLEEELLDVLGKQTIGGENLFVLPRLAHPPTSEGTGRFWGKNQQYLEVQKVRGNNYAACVLT